MELKEVIESLQKDIAQLTKEMSEKKEKGLESEVKELSDKLAGVLKEQAERKHQFEVSKAIPTDKKEIETRIDELMIAKALCVNVDTKQFDQEAYNRIARLPQYQDAIKAFGDVSAMQTGSAGEGQEWIPTAFSSTLYEEIFLSLEIAKLFGRIQMPAPTYVLPFRPSRLIAHAGTEGGTVTKDKGKTGKITFDAKKIMSIVEMTDEFEQDSLVPALNFLRQQLIEGFALAQETMCLNGDSGTTIYSSAPGNSEDARRLVDGIREDATNAAKGNAAVDLSSGGFSAANLRSLRTKMGKYGKKPSDLAYIVNMDQYNKILAFDGYQKLYDYGQGAVLLAGELGRIDNIPIIVTELLPEAARAADAPDALGGLNASGVWDNTTKTKGTVVLVNKNGYLWGDRKEFRLELWRNPLNLTTNLIGSQRLDFQKVGATTAPFTAVGINF